MPPKTKPNSKHLPTRFAFETQLSAKFQQALALHQQGQLAHAQVGYLKILKIQPKHFETLHLLGVIASQTNDHQRAVDLIDQAIALHPTNPYFYNNRGIALHKLTQSDKAIESYDKAIALKPDFFEVHSNRGNTLLELNQVDAALQSYDRAIAVKPDYAEGYNNRANALNELMRLDDAMASCNKAIAIKPNYAEAYSTLGMTFKKRQQWDMSKAVSKRLLSTPTMRKPTTT
jgi:protein O-GlcNAc transferase